MTGYGSFEAKNDFAQIYIEIKSLNSRFFDFYSKSCKTLSVYDDEAKNKIKSTCFRGNFQFKTKMIFTEKSQLKINSQKVKEYLKFRDDLIAVSKSYKESPYDLGLLSIDKLMSMKDIYEQDSVSDNTISSIKTLYFKCLDGAILELNNSRSIEGNNIQDSLVQNLNALQKGLETVLNLYKKNIDDEFDIYKNKITKILENYDLDESRLYQEIAIIIDKQDINEEVVRLASHLDVLKGYLLENTEIGKKINFILQEIGREINTITSKSSNIKITYEILDMKNQVEQIREQAQNIL